MNIRTRPTAEETRLRIVDAAEDLFLRLGYAKTAVADIAAALRMSPANVYRFFPSKQAIVEAICTRCMGRLEERLWALARAKEISAPERLERLVLETLAYHRETCISEQRVHDMVLAAIEHSWSSIHAHKKAVRDVVERILQDGVEQGALAPMDTHETARLFMNAVVRFMHPVLIAHGLAEDLETEARKTVRFLLKAMRPDG
jgi:AcrR family transcriptional regulator